MSDKEKDVETPEVETMSAPVNPPPEKELPEKP